MFLITHRIKNTEKVYSPLVFFADKTKNRAIKLRFKLHLSNEPW